MLKGLIAMLLFFPLLTPIARANFGDPVDYEPPTVTPTLQEAGIVAPVADPQATDSIKKRVLINITRLNWHSYRFSSEPRGFLSKNLSYEWNFGDRQYSGLPSPKHVYDQPGRYEVTLRITDKATGLSFFSKSQTVIISFYNIANKSLWLMLGGFTLINLAIFRFYQKKQKRNQQFN